MFQNVGKYSYLNFLPSTVNPFCIIRHAVNIREGLDSFFYFAGVVQDTASTVHMVDDRLQGEIGGSISKNGGVPARKVWVTFDEGRECLPLISWGNNARPISSHGSRTGVGWLEWVLGPGKCTIGRKSGGSEGCSVCLTKFQLPENVAQEGLLTVEGYTGTMNSLLVAVANRPIASLALTAELAAASPAVVPLPLLLLLLFLFRLPTTPPTTAAIMTTIRTGMPIFSQVLERFLTGLGVIKPDDSL